MFKTRAAALAHARGLGLTPISNAAAMRVYKSQISAANQKLLRLAHAASKAYNINKRNQGPLAPLNMSVMPTVVRRSHKSPIKKPSMSKKVYDGLMSVLKNTRRTFMGEYPSDRIKRVRTQYQTSKKAATGRSVPRTAQNRQIAAMLVRMSKGQR